EPAETATLLRELSMRLGGLGWPALAVLVLTGGEMGSIRGITPAVLFPPGALAAPMLPALAPKLLLRAGVVAVQVRLRHRAAARARAEAPARGGDGRVPDRVRAPPRAARDLPEHAGRAHRAGRGARAPGGLT